MVIAVHLKYLLKHSGLIFEIISSTNVYVAKYQHTASFNNMSKITDLIKHENKPSYSFEVTPDITEEVINNLTVEPLFFSITWHTKVHQNKNLDIAPIRLARYLRSKDKRVLMHLTCDMLRTEYLNSLLSLFEEIGVCNLLVLLGERYESSTSDFKNTNELIAHIRNRTDKIFCIGVAGSPESPDDKILHLKEKIDSGADFILTQAFFEIDTYKNYLRKCEEFDIKVPIIPGLFVFETYKQLTNFIDLCRVKVSPDLLEHVKNKGNESESVHNGNVMKELIQNLTTQCNVTHFHFYTLNKLDIISNFVTQKF